MPALARVLRNEDEDKGSQPSLFNIANRGLSLMTKSGALQTAGDCSINLLGTARSSPHNLKGYDKMSFESKKNVPKSNC